ncbi:MAG: TPM domain-containing protein [Cyanobacteria bacterium J06600_6]
MKTLTAIKHTLSLGFISSTVLLSSTASQALTVQEVVNPRQTDGGWVTDMADILSDRTEAELNRLITDLEAKNGTEVAVVTVLETEPADSPKAFATQLFNYWGIGKAESDNGILFLVSLGDRRVEIETGYGIEAILADTQVAKVIETKITPQYKKGDYNRGTLDGTIALIDSLEGVTVQESAPTAKNISWNSLLLFSGVGITFIGGFTWFKNKLRKVWINPNQAIVSLDRQDTRDVYCAKCQEPMQRVQEIKLAKIQQVARKIGAVSYRGYTCSDCSNPLQPYSLIAYTSRSSRYQKCYECQEFTVTRTGEILKPPSYTSKGERTIKYTCHCCENVREKTEILPALSRQTNTRSRSRTSSGGSYGYYSGGGSGFSSGGGFGGGSSGGGGAGGDF